MLQLTRPTALKLAAVLSLVVAIIGVTLYDLPNLLLGAAASRSPYPLVLGSFVTDVLAFVAAYGAWRNQKWGAVLLIAINAFWVVQAVSGLLFDTTSLETVFAGVMLAHHLVVITLCLWREPAVA